MKVTWIDEDGEDPLWNKRNYTIQDCQAWCMAAQICLPISMHSVIT